MSHVCDPAIVTPLSYDMCFDSVLSVSDDPFLLSEPGHAHEVHGPASVSTGTAHHPPLLPSHLLVLVFYQIGRAHV